MTYTLGAVVNGETVQLAAVYARLRGAKEEPLKADVDDAVDDRVYLQDHGHDIGPLPAAVSDPVAIALIYGAVATRRGSASSRLVPRVQIDAEDAVHFLRQRGFGVVPWSGGR